VRLKGSGRFASLVGVAVATLVAAPTGASAATQIGQTVDPSASDCSEDRTRLQVDSSSSDHYRIPFDGVITSWSFLGGDVVPSQIKLKVAELDYAAFSSYVFIAGESAFETPAANTLNTFPTRIPVKAGYGSPVLSPTVVIGFYFPSPNHVQCAALSAPGYFEASANGDIPGGGTGFVNAHNSEFQLDVSAQLERDADHDGFGDETQDRCLGTAGPQIGCTGKRPAAIKNCKKKFQKGKKRKRCMKKAKKLPA